MTLRLASLVEDAKPDYKDNTNFEKHAIDNYILSMSILTNKQSTYDPTRHNIRNMHLGICSHYIRNMHSHHIGNMQSLYHVHKMFHCATTAASQESAAC